MELFGVANEEVPRHRWCILLTETFFKLPNIPLGSTNLVTLNTTGSTPRLLSLLLALVNVEVIVRYVPIIWDLSASPCTLCVGRLRLQRTAFWRIQRK
jgi:hypothetical protein